MIIKSHDQVRLREKIKESSIFTSVGYMATKPTWLVGDLG